MAYIRKIQIDNIVYEAKVDFRTALKCNQIASDKSIGNFERVSGIICTMFGKDAVDHLEHYDKLINWALNYLSCGQDLKQNDNEKPDMDYEEDMDYIEASFMSDYKIDLEKEDMEWHKFYKLLNGLSNSEFGNCCILNRIRNLRKTDLSQIKDNKIRQELAKAQKQFELKKYKKENNLTKEQEESMNRLNEILGL